jgi:hypothetical protein
MKLKFSFFTLFAALLLSAGCEKDKKTQQENITKITVHLSGSGGFDQEFSWSDPDGGDTGNASIDEIVIPAGTTDIQGHLFVLDESQNPVVDLSEEIEEEAEEHLFVYRLSGTALTQVNYNDVDANGKPLGLATKWTAGTGAGSLNILLYHQPDTKDDLSSPGGDIDFDITFQVKVQ